MSDNAGDLTKFRDEWRRELLSKEDPAHEVKGHSSVEEKDGSVVVESADIQCSLTSDADVDNEAPFPFQFTDSLLRSWNTSPDKQQDRSTVSSQNELEDEQPVAKKSRRSLVDIFIDDLNELDDIPFFDIDLPRELALKIFMFLDMKDLCTCAQVSKAWKSLSDDNALWMRIYRSTYLLFVGHSMVESSDNWKSVVRDGYTNTKVLQLHWKEHKCHITFYHHARGGILTDADSFDTTIAAGYTNGQVKVWDVMTNETQTFTSSNQSLVLVEEDNDEYLGTSENFVTCVKLGRRSSILAGYNHGNIQLWNYDDDEATFSTQFPGYSVKNVAFSSIPDIGYAVISHPANKVCYLKVLDLSNESLGQIDVFTLRERGSDWTLPETMIAPLQAGQSDPANLLVLSRDCLRLHSTTRLHGSWASHMTSVEQFYGTHFTCLHTSRRHLCLGMVSHLGTQAEYRVRTYDPQTVRQTFDLRSHTSKVTCVDSSHPSGYMIATGCHDRRVRLFDSRQPSSTVRTFMGHAGSVLCVQADDWKIVSGDTEGYVCVWDQRKGVKLWESQSRHPVRRLQFTSSRLVTANIPSYRYQLDLDSDKMTHIRYRGRLQACDFSVDQQTVGVPTICSSTYDAPEASTYNIALMTPYDKI